jgi:SAM-dependent methyltransferase
MSAPFTYVGSELDLFAAATNWKSYCRAQIGPYLGSEVLEVGAGFGGTTRVYCRGTEKRWVGVEPDPQLADRLAASIRDGSLPACCTAVTGTIADTADLPPFDSILYADVLEHIAEDKAEVAAAAERLVPGGHLIVLGPAHQWLFTPFDQAIGHYRRYTRPMLAALTPPSLEIVRNIYMDSVGLAASLANRLLLKQSMPTPRQIATWDKLMVRTSRLVDPLIGRNFGKSVLTVWRKKG